VLDERGHSVHLTDQGVETMSPQDPDLFIVPDILHAVHVIDHNQDLPAQQKIERRLAGDAESALTSEKVHIIDNLIQPDALSEKEETEFDQIYKLDVLVMPTNRAVRRVDKHDLIYKTRREKYNAILDEVERQHARGLPVLVGTVNVDVSETLSRMLKRRGLKHEVLNAKYHQREAEIVAQAGQPAA